MALDPVAEMTLKRIKGLGLTAKRKDKLQQSFQSKHKHRCCKRGVCLLLFALPAFIVFEISRKQGNAQGKAH